MPILSTKLMTLVLISIGAWIGFILGDFTGMLVSAFFGWLARKLVGSTMDYSR